MTLTEIQDIDIKGRNIAIIGAPASGKTYLAAQLKGSHVIVHTDSFIHLGWDNAVLSVIDHLNVLPGNWICEGVQVIRMLRKGVEIGNWAPQLIIQCERPRYK